MVDWTLPYLEFGVQFVFVAHTSLEAMCPYVEVQKSRYKSFRDSRLKLCSLSQCLSPTGHLCLCVSIELIIVGLFAAISTSRPINIFK